MKNKIDTIIGEIDELLNWKPNSIQLFDNFLNWQERQTKVVDNTKNTLLFKSENHLKFFTVIPPNTTFPVHWHDVREVCTVISGVLFDNETKQKFMMGEKCVYPKYTKHQPQNNSDKGLYLIVDFYKKIQL